jgi:hypothetical protein
MAAISNVAAIYTCEAVVDREDVSVWVGAL